jgi:hypothetical protein
MKTKKNWLLIAAISFSVSANAQIVYQPTTQTVPTTAAPTTAKPTAAKGWKPKSKKKWGWYPGCCVVKKVTTVTQTSAPMPAYKSVLMQQQAKLVAPPAAPPVAQKVTDAENTFPLIGNAGIGTLTPGFPLEINKSAGDGNNKNYMINLSNVWAENGLNEPSIMFSNGDPENISYWSMGARVSGDKAHDNPIAFKIGFKPPKEKDEKEFFSIDAYNGRVKIGNCNSNMDGYKLFVEEGILTEKVKVAVKNSDEWFDNVFEPSYKIMPIKDLETYIKNNKHLPEIPTTSDVLKDGIDIGKMNGLLLKKVEELTLYMIDLKKQLDETKKQLDELKAK